MWTTWQKSGWGVTCLKWVPESRVMGKSDGYFQMWRMGGFLLWNLDSVQHQTSQLKSIQKNLSKKSINKSIKQCEEWWDSFFDIWIGCTPPNFPVAIHPKGITGGPMNVTQSYISPKRCLSVKTMNEQLFLGCMVTDRVRAFLYQNFIKPVQNTG